MGLRPRRLNRSNTTRRGKNCRRSSIESPNRVPRTVLEHLPAAAALCKGGSSSAAGALPAQQGYASQSQGTTVPPPRLRHWSDPARAQQAGVNVAISARGSRVRATSHSGFGYPRPSSLTRRPEGYTQRFLRAARRASDTRRSLVHMTLVAASVGIDSAGERAPYSPGYQPKPSRFGGPTEHETEREGASAGNGLGSSRQPADRGLGHRPRTIREQPGSANDETSVGASSAQRGHCGASGNR